MPLSKDKTCHQYSDPKTCLDAHVQLVSLNWMLFTRRKKKAPFSYKYKLSQKEPCLRLAYLKLLLDSQIKF